MGKMPKYKIIVSDRSRKMLANHIRFLAQKSPSAARKLKNRLMDAIHSLYKMPGRLPFLDADFIPPTLISYAYYQILISGNIILPQDGSDLNMFIY